MNNFLKLHGSMQLLLAFSLLVKGFFPYHEIGDGLPKRDPQTYDTLWR